MRTAIVLLLVSCLQIAGQTGSITGSVKDPNGKALSGISVIAFNLDTGDAFESRTGEEGRYKFLELTMGDYELTVAHEGFELYSSPELKVDGKKPAQHDIQMEATSGERKRSRRQ